jgi:hypothetical protein
LASRESVRRAPPNASSRKLEHVAFQ